MTESDRRRCLLWPINYCIVMSYGIGVLVGFSEGTWIPVILASLAITVISQISLNWACGNLRESSDD